VGLTIASAVPAILRREMDAIEPSPEQEYEVIQDEIALWEKQQVIVANELYRLRVRLRALRARLEDPPPEESGPSVASPPADTAP
jgi:hypothetical protein